MQNNDIERLYKYSTESGWDCDYMRFFGTGHAFKSNYFHGTIASEVGTPPNNAHVDCFQTWDAGSAPASSNITLDSNVCTDMADFLMAEGQNDKATHDIIIRNNVIANTLRVVGCGDGINLKDIYNVTIVGNTFCNLGNIGVYVHEVTPGLIVNVRIKNNIFDTIGSSSHYAYSFNFPGSIPSTVASDYNLLNGCAPDGGKKASCSTGGTGIGGCNDITTTDTKFVNPTILLGTDGILFTADDGLNIQSSSPAIGVGDNLSSLGSSYALDILGNSRSSSWDIGAYEYTPGGDTTPPAAPTGLAVY